MKKLPGKVSGTNQNVTLHLVFVQGKHDACWVCKKLRIPVSRIIDQSTPYRFTYNDFINNIFNFINKEILNSSTC